jgi:hypothetical protein
VSCKYGTYFFLNLGDTGTVVLSLLCQVTMEQDGGDDEVTDWKDARCIRITGGKGPNYRWDCTACQRTFTGGGRKLYNHVLGINGWRGTNE